MKKQMISSGWCDAEKLGPNVSLKACKRAGMERE